MRKRLFSALLCLMLALSQLTAFAESESSAIIENTSNSGINWICPYCSSELRTQDGFNNTITTWTCKSCGKVIDFPSKDLEGFDPVESFKGARFPGIYGIVMDAAHF